MVDALYAAPEIGSTESDFATFGPVHLDITDRDLGFWRDLIGLNLLHEADGALHLGAGETELIVLHPGATAPLRRNASGLYHLSLHLPTLGDFARAVARLRAAGYHHYPTDHVTHLACYADDFDGIGLELAYETPRRLGSMSFGERGPELVDSSGRRRSGRDPIDLEWLFRHIPDDDAPASMPAGTIVGHLHLRVSDFDASLAFYRDLIGFTPNMAAPGFGMFDMTAGGTFPHRLAGNVWESGGAQQRPPETAGMRHFTIDVRAETAFRAAVDRLEAAGRILERRGRYVATVDPSGTKLVLAAPA